MFDFSPPPPDTRTVEQVIKDLDELIRVMLNSGIKSL